MSLTFGLTVFAWIFFRAENLSHAFNYISQIFSGSLFSIPEIRPKNITLFICFLITVEWIGRNNKFALENLHLRYPIIVRYLIYIILATAILLFSVNTEQTFIYFQF